MKPTNARPRPGEPDRGDLERQIADVAVAAALAAGAILEANADRGRTVVQAKGHDLKLEIDRLSENAIVETIRKAFPTHAIMAEESGESPAGAAYLWIVDPLDGTVNYFHGLPYYCVSVACYAMPCSGRAAGPSSGIDSLGRSVVGVVHAPPTDELFLARAGHGATRNGRPIHAAGLTDLSEAMFCMGFGKTDALGRHMAAASLRLAAKVRKLRCLGAAAYDLANVACGRLGGFFEMGLRTWDIAAGHILLKEAGGHLYAEQYRPTRWTVLASAPGIHESLREELIDPRPAADGAETPMT